MWQKLSILLLLFLNIEARIIVDEATQNHLALAECARLVTERYISSKTNTVVIQERCSTCIKDLKNFNYRVLDHYLKSLQGLVSLQLFFGRDNAQPWNYNIFIVDTTFTFSELRVHIPNTFYEREFYFIVILTHRIHDWSARMQNMKQIFKMCIHLKVINVVILQQEPEVDNSIGFYTFSMAGSFCGTSIFIEEVNRYRNGRLERDNLFSPTQHDFHGCIINVTAHILYPMLQFNGDRRNRQHLMDIDRLTGIEGDLLRILAKVLNFSVSLQFPREWSTTNMNHNPTRRFAQLEAGVAEIAIGGFSISDPDRLYYSISLPYHQAKYVFVVRSGLHFGPLRQLANPFCPTVWVTIALTFAVAFALFKFIDIRKELRLRHFILGSHNKYPNTNMLTIFLGNPINRPPRRNFARFLLMCWLLATLILRNAYQGKLFDSLRVSRRITTPKTIKELIDENYKLLSSAWVGFYPPNQTIITCGDNDALRYAKIDSTIQRYTTISMLETLAFYNWMNWNTSRMTFVEEPIFTLQLAMYFQKHSVLKHIFDTKIQQLMSSGITSFVAKTHSRTEFQTLNIGKRLLPRISNDMLRGLYALYGILMGVALIYFILELLSLRVQILQRFFTWAHCTECKC